MATHHWADALRSRVRVMLLVAVVLLWLFVVVAGSLLATMTDIGGRQVGVRVYLPRPAGEFALSPRSDPLPIAIWCP